MKRLTLRVVLGGGELDAADDVGGSEGGGSVIPDSQDTQIVLHPWDEVCDYKRPVGH